MRGGGSQSATNFVMRLRRSKQASDRSQPALLLSPLTASHRVPPLLSCHRDSKPVASREHHKGRRCDGLAALIFASIALVAIVLCRTDWLIRGVLPMLPGISE